MSIRDDFFAAKAKGSLWDVAVSIKRGNPLPLDADSIFESYAALEAYAADVLAYPGQVVAVVNADSTGIYYLDQNLAIKPVGVIPAGDNVSVEMDENDVISLHDFGKAFYKYVPANGDVAAHYEKVEVSEENPWIAGLEPKVTAEGLGWYEPNPTTVDGVNSQVTALANRMATAEADIDAIEADYLKAADKTELTEAIAAEAERADAAEKANAAAIKAIADDYLKGEDKYDDTALAARVKAIEDDYLTEEDKYDDTALAARVKAIEDDYLTEADKYDDTAVVNRIATIEADYLKAEHIANMATDDEVEAAVAAEAEARVNAINAEAKSREDADKALQNQIDLIMNNPDTENVINSIEEFSKYIEDHGEIAEGFRTDIGDNAAAIANEIDRATKAEAALSGRVDVLETIDHDAYIDADAALKSELEGKINLKADATALTNAVAALESDIADLEAADAELVKADEAMADRIEALEDKFGEGEDTVADMIAVAKQAAIDAAAADATAKANAAEAAAIAAAATDASTKASAAQAAAIADADAKLALKANSEDVANTYATKEFVGSIPTGYTETNVIAYVNKKAEEVLTQATGGSSESAASVKAQLDTYKTENAPKFEKLEGIEAGAQVNVIESVVAHAEAKVTAITDGKVVTINDAALREAIATAKTQADKGVSDAAAVDAKATVNAEEISKHNTRLGVLEDAKTDHLNRITALESHDETHTAEFNTLSSTVSSHSTTIADWTNSKADTSALNEAVARIAKNESDIATKANASALNDYYTKTEVGTIANGKTLVEMIEDAKVAATYDDTAVKALISAEGERAVAEEERLAGLIAANITNIADNTAEIARVNGVLVAALENDQEGLDSIKELATWIESHGKDAAAMVESITANSDAIAAINHIETGILAQAKAFTEEQVAAIPVATASALGLVKFDDVTVKMNESKQLYVAKVSTDVLEQGSNILILNGGSATE